MTSSRELLPVRPVRREDHAQWRPLWDGYNAFYGRSGPTALDERITAAGSSRIYWTTQTTNAAGRALYDKLAEYRGFIVYSRELGGS